MINNLTDSFIKELFCLIINDKNYFEIILKYMKFSYLQKEEEKKIWQYLSKEYRSKGLIPTKGQIQQKFIDEGEVLELLQEIYDIELDTIKDKDILKTFEDYLKNMMFLEANELIVEEYRRGEKDKSYSILIQSAEKIVNFSITPGKFETVFGDFKERNAERKNTDYSKRYRIPTGIEELDNRLGGINGGVETGECVLWLADSGVGKSQALIHMGITASRLGNLVVHFQLEGTKEQCLNRYDASWTGTLYGDMKIGNISSTKIKALERIIGKLNRNDIYVISEESFNKKTLIDVRNDCAEIQKMYGKIGMIVIDYLELLELGDGINYTPGEERFRQTKLARGMKMLAMEFNCVVHTATASNSISEEDRNDPEFVITRVNLSEDKGKIRPFDIFITMNQTRDEQIQERMRLYTDKLREHKTGRPITIFTNYDYSRFYDRKRTLNYEPEED